MGDFPSVLQTSVASLALLFPHHSTQSWARSKLGTKSWPAQSPKHTRASMITISEEPAPAYKLSAEWDLAESSTACLHGGGRGLGLKQ